MLWNIFFPILAVSTVVVSEFLWHWSRSPFDLAQSVAAAVIVAVLITRAPLRFAAGLVSIILIVLAVAAVLFSGIVWHWLEGDKARLMVMLGAGYLMSGITGDFFAGPFDRSHASSGNSDKHSGISFLGPRRRVGNGAYPAGWWKNTWVYLLMGTAALIVIISNEISHWTNSDYALAIVAIGAAFVANYIARDVVRAPFFHELRRRLSSK
jgi:hypothetical protein